MKKKDLKNAVEKHYTDTQRAIIVMYESVTAKGQRDRMLKNKDVQELFEKYDIHVDDEGVIV